MSRAQIYDERFVKAFPIDWEVEILSKYLIEKGNLLDVGCGTGRHVVLLAEKGFDVTGIDKDREFIKASQMKLKLKKLNARLIIADARKLPLRNNLFGYIISMGVLGDVGVHKKDREIVLDEMKRASKTDGTLIIELVHRYWKASDLFSWAWKYLATTWQRLCGKSIEYGDYTETIRINHGNKHTFTFHAFTTSEARKLLLSRGLHVKIEKRGKVFHDWFFLVGRLTSI